MSPAAQPHHLHPGAVSADAEPVPAHPDQRDDLRVIAAEQGGHALFGGGRVGLLTS